MTLNAAAMNRDWFIAAFSFRRAERRRPEVGGIGEAATHMSATAICTAAGATRGCTTGAEPAENASEGEKRDSMVVEVCVGETRAADHG